uniref:Uncharacterized protein n=1 Tax=Anguilla anguilla TaxID=7936 RepID=A0A0E9WIM8_ANGAN
MPLNTRMLVVSYSISMSLSFLDNHVFLFLLLLMLFLSMLLWCTLGIVFISWQTVVCLLNSTALSLAKSRFLVGPCPRSLWGFVEYV